MVLFTWMTASALAGVTDEPLGVSLLRPDSLTGWEYAATPPAGWTIAGGKLCGGPGATPLLSGWTFGNFEFRLQWSTDRGAAWKIALPEVPDGKGLELLLSEDARCGQLSDAGRQLAPGKNVQPLGGKMHRAALQRQGGRLSLAVDGQRVFAVPVKPQRRFGLGLSVEGGQAELCDLLANEPRGEPIFSGKDLTGWWCPTDIHCWAAQDGKIVWAKRGGNYLRTERLFANFTFSCDYKTAKETNSGIGIRTPRLGWPSGDGMEMQIWDKPSDVPLDKHQTMAIYGNVPPLARNDRSQEWNHVVIKADGRMISAWMNGVLVQQANTLWHPELKHRHLAGWIGLQDHNGGIEFRNLYVLTAPDGLGLAAWSKPRPTRATDVLIDRLMNPETLALADCLTAGVVAVKLGQPQKDEPPPAKEEPKRKKKDAEGKKSDGKRKKGDGPKKSTDAGSTANAKSKISGSLDSGIGTATPSRGVSPGSAGPTQPGSDSARSTINPELNKKSDAPKKPPVTKVDFVLAELVGPGALVRVARTSREGTLAFYFDGESKPRLQCKPDELFKAGPELSDDVNPTLTCLTYQKSLKVVLLGASGADYRLDYVTLPKSMAVESFHGPEAGFTRGWLPAMNYRYHQHSGGTLRDYDPLPRFLAEKRMLAPAQARPMIHIDGAGVVQWIKVQAPKQALETSDLWLEVAIDGQTQPAVAAPARFWFPGLAGQGNYHNFLMLERNGMALRLAMPFGRGITITAVNRGSKPIADVGMIVSAELATEQNQAQMAQRMRLRGVFQPAGQHNDELINLQGAGRWIGLVYQQPTGRPTGINALLVDGQSRSEWAASDLEPFLGDGDRDFRRCQSGRHGPLCWRYLALECVDFTSSLVLKATDKSLGDRLVWYYSRQ